MVYGLVGKPGFTDAFYHFNAAVRLVEGRGFTDDYLWTYIAAPDTLPAPSHLYWMPLTSLSGAIGMAVLNAPGNYAAAQWPLALMFAGLIYTGFWLGLRLGGTARHAWAAGLLTLFSGFFVRFWGMTDTFAPYALPGALCLVFLGLGEKNSQKRWYALSGAMAGLGHLARADGVLLLIVGWMVVLWPLIVRPAKMRALCLLLFTAGYVLVMLPWFARNLQAVGSVLPTGGAQAIWFLEYDDLFNYPPSADAQRFFDAGLSAIVDTRLTALSGNLGTFLAVEGLIVMAPLMLVALWRRRSDRFLRGFWLYALGLHVVMTLAFPFPGYRGGLLHSAAALVPWWAALGVVGIDDAVVWAARKRRRWNVPTAQQVFTVALVVLAVLLSANVGLRGRIPAGETPDFYKRLEEALPADARVMINDPAQLYYYTGMGGVVLPSEAAPAILDIARLYGISYVVLEYDGLPRELFSVWDTPPDFMTPVSFTSESVKVYAIIR